MTAHPAPTYGLSRSPMRDNFQQNPNRPSRFGTMPPPPLSPSPSAVYNLFVVSFVHSCEHMQFRFVRSFVRSFISFIGGEATTI